MAANTHVHRFDGVYQRDCLGVLAMIALLWTVVLFALYMAWPFMPSQTIRTVSLVAVVLVLLFNTASICTMITHYAEDEE